MSFVSIFSSPDETTSPNLVYLFHNPPRPLALHEKSDSWASRAVNDEGSLSAVYKPSGGQEAAENAELYWESYEASPSTSRINSSVIAGSDEDYGKQPNLLGQLMRILVCFLFPLRAVGANIRAGQLDAIPAPHSVHRGCHKRRTTTRLGKLSFCNNGDLAAGGLRGRKANVEWLRRGLRHFMTFVRN